MASRTDLVRGRLTEASDEALVAAYVGGDQRAFDLLVDRYQQRVYAICYRYFGNPSDAEDASQDAFLALLRRAETFQGTASFSTWMYRVATNACNDLARKRARRPQTTPLAGSERADLPDPEDVLATRELGMELTAALRTLDAEQREAIVLHDVAGVGYAELAERYGVAVGTVKSRIHRAHARLAELLTPLTPSNPEPSTSLPPPTKQP